LRRTQEDDGAMAGVATAFGEVYDTAVVDRPGPIE
jgi:hypothetical protein